MPLCCPNRFGAKATESAQLAWPFSELPHPFTTVKSPLVMSAAISVSGTSPVFVSVTVCTGLAVSSACSPKVNAPGASPSVAIAVPVPSRLAVCVPALSTTVNRPVLLPEAVGLKTNETVHPVCGARLLPQVFCAIVKSPLIVSEVSVARVPPRFETVMFCTALVIPRFVAGKISDTGVSTIAAAAVPLPVSATVA